MAIDYVQTSDLGSSNSLFQTAFIGTANDGDLWVAPDGTVGVDDVGYSTTAIDPSKWHRIVLSVDNGNFFRVYVDGTLLLDGPGQPVDGRFSVYPDRFNLFADDTGEDRWGLVGNVMTWNHALTTAEISGMGGWIGGSSTPTPLIFGETPEITSVLPWDGETNVAPTFAFQATIVDVLGLVDTNTIQLLLDGAPLTPVVTAAQASMKVTFSGGGLLPSGSTHTYTLIAGSSGVFATNEVTFTVQRYSGYEWNFASGNLSAALGNGVMEYASPSTPGLTSFGTTDGSTVPHINGTPAKFMHVSGFTDESDGYWLTFSDSGPNVGANAQINRYTLVMDILVPSPWSSPWIVPFFNTDPYDLNDADFYLALDGSIGIGSGYSTPGVMAPDTWYRVAFVADLEANTLTYYVNGTEVATRAGDGLVGRWAMYSNQDAGPDLLLFNEGDPSGVYTHALYLSSVACVDRNFSAAEVAALGGPKASGILVHSLTPAPTLAAKHSGSGSHPGRRTTWATRWKAKPAWPTARGFPSPASRTMPWCCRRFPGAGSSGWSSNLCRHLWIRVLWIRDSVRVMDKMPGLEAARSCLDVR